MTEKRCSKCRRILPTSEFGVNTTIKSGLHSWCRECVRIANKEKRATNKEKKDVVITPKKAKRGFTELRNCGIDFLKSESTRGGILFYFPKPKECFCNDGLECMNCWYQGTSKIKKALKDDPDYKYEEQIIGVEKATWENKLKKHRRAEEI